MQITSPYEPPPTDTATIERTSHRSSKGLALTGFLLFASFPIVFGAYTLYRESVYQASLPPNTAACGMGSLGAIFIIAFLGPLFGFVLVALLIASGCETRTSLPRTAARSATPVRPAASATTVERVRKIVSEQMGVAVAIVTPKTSLGDLAADELDFVELIMELEEAFSITISDDKTDALTGNQDWQRGMNNVTIEKLSELVNDLTQ